MLPAWVDIPAMTTIRDRGEAVRRFILQEVEKHPSDIVKLTSEKFSCSRQAVHKHIRRLVTEGALAEAGKTRSRKYRIPPLVEWKRVYHLGKVQGEDEIWRSDIAPSLGAMPDNVSGIWHYGFTEMFNNAIDHSGGSRISVSFEKTAVKTVISIYDDGVGIFRKIQAALGLLDERHSVLELAKGKLTTDPKHHSGEGIFFSSRMFDSFAIMSGGVYFSHEFNEESDWIMQSESSNTGTSVWMSLNNHTARTAKKIFDKFTTDDDYGFTKTIVPVKLAQYGGDNLVSRSQAKRLLDRIDRFKVVLFDFTGVEEIGQAFADEIFRVFALKHPKIEISAIHAGTVVKRMISRALVHEEE